LKFIKWTFTQRERAELVFDLYPDMEKAYKLSLKLTGIFNQNKDRIIAFTKFDKWHEEVRLAGFKSFNTIAKTIETHYQTILNYFDSRSTNPSAASFNAKIKSYINKFRGCTMCRILPLQAN